MVTSHNSSLKFSNKPFLILFSIITATIIILDQLLKYLILTLQPQKDIGWISIHLITNTGAGFGILAGKTIWLALVSLLVALGIIYYYRHIPKQRTIQLLFALFLGGVIGNFIDRALRGYVVDFIDLKWWPAFNLADAVLSISVIGLVIYYWHDTEEEKR